MAENIGTARADLTIDTRDYELSLERAKGKTVGFSEATQAAHQKLEGRQKTSTDRLLQYVHTLERSTDARRLLSAAENDVPKEIWQEASARISAYNNAVLMAEQHTRALADAMEEAARWNAEFDKHRSNLTTDHADAQAAQQAWRRAEATEALTLALMRQEAAEEALAGNADFERQQQAAQLAWRRAEATEALTLALMREEAAEEAVRNLDAVAKEENKAQLAWRRAEATEALTLALMREEAAEEALRGNADFERQQQAAQLAWRRAEATEALSLALERQEAAEANQKWLTQLQRQTTVLGMSTAEMLEYEAAERGITAQAAPLIAAFRSKEAAIRAETGALMTGKKWNDQYNMSQKQLEFAMRGLPAQITDIFISLQGGQAPLTVLLQQGGQLKDMFGGIGNAARVLSGHLISLASNPYVLLATAVAGVGAAYLSSEQRINAMNEALIMSGNAANLTTEDLEDMVAALDAMEGITGRGAAAALTEVASSGKIARESFDLVAEAAERMRSVTGKAVADTVREYEELAKDPYDAVLRLNEAENFLTNAMADRIKALVDAGQIEEAAALATEERARAQIERTQEVIENLGLVTGAWHSIKRATAEALSESTDYFSNLYRDAKEATTTLANFSNSWKLGGVAGVFGAQASLFPSVSGATKKAQEEVNEAARRQLDAIEAGNRTREEAQEAEEKRIRNLGAAANKSAEEIEKMVAKSRASYEASKPKGSKGQADALQDEALARFRNQFKEEQAQIKAQSEQLKAAFAERTITAREYYDGQIALRQREFSDFERSNRAQIDYLQGQKDSAKNRKEIGDLESAIAQRRIETESQVNSLLSEQRKYEKERANSLLDYKRALEGQENALMRQNQAQLESMGLSSREAEMVARVTDLYFRQADALQQLEDQKRRDGKDDEWLKEREEALRASTERQVQIIRDGYEAMGKARGDWASAWRASIAELTDEASNVAGQTTSVFDTITSGFSDSFKTLRRESKLTFDSIGESLADLLIEFGTNKIMAWIMGMFAPANSAGSMTGFGNNMDNFTGFAKGGVQNSPSLSRYSNQVHDSPKGFAFAKGAGIFGEAGPEAIMPLSRDSSGRLGITAQGAGAGAAPEITLNVYGGSGEPQVDVSRTAEGGFSIDLILDQAFAREAGKIMNGTSQVGTALKRRFAIQER